MADYTKIILRQGPDNEKNNVTLRSGEPAYITNYKRLFIGDGTTGGGITVGTKFLGFAVFDEYSLGVDNVSPGYDGDIMFETTTNLLYVLSGSETVIGKEAYQLQTNYIPINQTPLPDNVNIYNNNGTLSLIQDSIDARYLAGYSIGRGLARNTSNPSILEIKDPSPELSFVSGTLQITRGGVSNDKLASMEANTVKARLNISGPPENISLDELKLALGIANESGSASLGVPVGTIIDYAGISAPNSYLPCDGRELPVTDYLELYKAIANTWGAPTLTSFNLPNLNKRTTIGQGNNVIGSTAFVGVSVGSYGGSEVNQLSLKQLPKHVHGVEFSIPNHSHAFTVSIPQFPGTYETGNIVVNGYNNYITVIGGNGPDAAPRTSPSGPNAMSLARSQASALIKQNKTYIQNRVINYIQYNFPAALSGVYTTGTSSTSAGTPLSAICYRDAGYIVDSFAADILNDANHRSIETGNLYFSGYVTANPNPIPGSPVPTLPYKQVIPTILAIESIGSYINGLNIPINPAGYTNIGILSSDVFFNPTQLIAAKGLRNFTNVISNSSFIPVTTPNGTQPDNTFSPAASTINLYKQQIQDRVVKFIQYNYPYALSGNDTSTTLTTEQLTAKCYRDTGFIVDSLVADIYNNANHRSIETGIFYFSGALLARSTSYDSNVPTLPEDQVNATIQAISAVGKFITGFTMPLETTYTTRGVLSANTFNTDSQRKMLKSLNNFTMVISNSADIPYTTPPGTRSDPTTSYDAAADTILQPTNKANLQQQVVNYVNYFYPYALSGTNTMAASALSAKCYRDTGFVIDSMAADLRNAANHRCVETGVFYFSGAVLSNMVNTGSDVPTLPADQVEATIAALSALGQYITGQNTSIYTLLPAPYRIITSKLLDSEDNGEQRIPDVINLTNTVIYPLQNNGASLTYNPLGSPTDIDIELSNTIANNRSTIQNIISAYVLSKQYLTPYTIYSDELSVKCNRDVGYMVDAVANDLKTGVNAKSIQYAVAYWDGSTSRLPEDLILNQRDNTLDVIEYLKSVMFEIAVNNSNNVSNLAIKKVNSLIEAMIYPLTNRGKSKEYNPAGTTTSENFSAANTLLQSKSIIQDKVTNYVINRNYLQPQTTLLSKCRRDVGFMLDAIANDLITGVNAKSVQYAISYWNGSTSRLPEDLIPNQRQNTIDTIQYLLGIVLDTIGGYGGILDQVKDLTKAMVYPFNNGGALIQYNPPGLPLDPDRQFAANLLEANRTSLQDKTIAYVKTLGIISTRQDLQAKCRRDVGYMVDSIVNDLRSGTSSRSIQYALSYWTGAVNRLKGFNTGSSSTPNQINATINTIKYLRDRCIDLIINSGGGNNTVTSYLTSYTAPSGAFNFNGLTNDGTGIEGEPIANVQPSAVVNKCIKVR